MNKKINKALDSLIPRGGVKPNTIHINLPTYLSRISNLNRKVLGTEYRFKQWTQLCDEHKIDFDKALNSSKKINFPNSNFKTFYISLVNIKLENEFESLLYSISGTLTALTRVIACFLEGATDFQSHSSLKKILAKYKKFSGIELIVTNARNSWAKDLTGRRDAAAHYIALSIQSSISRSNTNKSLSKKKLTKIGISKEVIQSISVWENLLPVLGGAQQTSMFGTDDVGNKQEIHKLLDKRNRLILQIDTPLPKKPELIDGEKYVKFIYKNYLTYLNEILSTLKNQLR